MLIKSIIFQYFLIRLIRLIGLIDSPCPVTAEGQREKFFSKMNKCETLDDDFFVFDNEALVDFASWIAIFFSIAGVW